MSEESVRSAPVLGIDIGGSGIKGAPVDLATGEFTAKRLRITTPQKSTPKNVAAVVAEIVDSFADIIGDGPIGVTIPAVVTHGKTRSAANIDKSWIDAEAEKIFEITSIATFCWSTTLTRPVSPRCITVRPRITPVWC